MTPTSLVYFITSWISVCSLKAVSMTYSMGFVIEMQKRLSRIFTYHVHMCDQARCIKNTSARLHDGSFSYQLVVAIQCLRGSWSHLIIMELSNAIHVPYLPNSVVHKGLCEKRLMPEGHVLYGVEIRKDGRILQLQG